MSLRWFCFTEGVKECAKCNKHCVRQITYNKTTNVNPPRLII